MRLRRLDSLDQRLDSLLYRRDDLLATFAVVTQSILRQRLAQALQHAVVVDDQPKVLSGIDPVCPCDRLHQVMGPHRLVDVEVDRHSTSKPVSHMAQTMATRKGWSGFLNAVRHRRAGHPPSRSPASSRARCGMMSKPHFLKSATSFCASLIMISTIVSSSQSGLSCELPSLLRKRVSDGLVSHRLGLPRFASAAPRTSAGFRPPPWNDQLKHPGAGDLVDADQHRLAGLPASCTVLDEIGRQLSQAFVGRDDLVVLAQQLVEQRLLVRVELGSSIFAAMRSFRSVRVMPSFSPRLS